MKRGKRGYVEERSIIVESSGYASSQAAERKREEDPWHDFDHEITRLVSNGEFLIDPETCEVKGFHTDEDLEIRQKLKKRFEIRWQNLVDKSKRMNKEIPDKEAVWNLVFTSFNNGFFCDYCGKKMLIKDSSPPYLRSFSLDHKISLFIGGDNSIENIAVVCHRCNIVKGTMKHDTFIELIRQCPPGLLDKIFAEIWAGRMANKLEREEKI